MHVRRVLSMVVTGLSCALILAAAAGANETVLRGSGDLRLAVSGGERIRMAEGPLLVRGRISLAPRADTLPGNYVTFVVDGQSAYSTNDPLPRLDLDTTTLPEGKHIVRIECLDGTRRVASTGDIALEIANQAVVSQMGQAKAAQPNFIKLYHKKILREIVWFNGREGDLERHGTLRGNHVLITANDLMRHIGGTIEWGPPGDLILLERNKITVQIMPGSTTVYVNGQPRQMQQPAFTVGNRTYVPIRSVCRFFGIQVDWDIYTDRAYVTYQM